MCGASKFGEYFHTRAYGTIYPSFSPLHNSLPLPLCLGWPVYRESDLCRHLETTFQIHGGFQSNKLYSNWAPQLLCPPPPARSTRSTEWEWTLQEELQVRLSGLIMPSHISSGLKPILLQEQLHGPLPCQASVPWLFTFAIPPINWSFTLLMSSHYISFCNFPYYTSFSRSVGF